MELSAFMYSSSVFLSIYNSYMERNYTDREANIGYNRSETPPNAIKRKICTQQEMVSQFYYFSPLFSHTNSCNNAVTHCHVDSAQRAWATCE